MLYNTFNTYPFTADYYQTKNNALPGNLPVWVDTFIKQINVQLGSDITGGRLQMFSQEELSLGWLVKNLRDVNGQLIQAGAPTDLTMLPNVWRINSCDPMVNFFGMVEGFKISLTQAGTLRAV